MSEKLPRVTAADAIRVLERAGFSFSRQSGSHKIYKNKESRRATVPYHSGKILHPDKVVIKTFNHKTGVWMETLERTVIPQKTIGGQSRANP